MSKAYTWLGIVIHAVNKNLNTFSIFVVDPFVTIEMNSKMAAVLKESLEILLFDEY